MNDLSSKHAKFRYKLKKRINDPISNERFADYCYQVTMPDGEADFFNLSYPYVSPPSDADIRAMAEHTAQRMIDGYEREGISEAI